MKKNKLAVLTPCLVLSGTFCTQAQNKTPQEIRIPDTYKLTNKSIYRNGWIDFNKNGKKDVYEVLRSRSMHVSKTSFRR